jgi:hypothetical protein
MNAKELVEWLEDRGELMVMKKDGEGFVIAARAADGMMIYLLICGLVGLALVVLAIIGLVK